MKKIQKTLVAIFALMLFNFASALEIVDVKSNYWAGQEIIHAIQNGFIYVVDGNKFKPEDSITRSDFVTALLKVIRRQDESVTQKTSFKDVNNLTPNKKSVMLSEQIRLAFGYPDKTFKPNVAINHNETMSMIANITTGDYKASDITLFKDYEEIPIWARRAYIKNVANDLYVNHPDEYSFTPSKNLTRAEAAVLFDKISANLDKIKDSYRNLYDDLSSLDNSNGNGNDNNSNYLDFDKSEFIANNTLGLAPFSTNNKVVLYNNKNIIEGGNILIGTNLGLVKTRKDLVGDQYIFTAPNDVYSNEGTFLYPKGTEFYARVFRIGYSAWRSKAEKSRFVFYKYSLPDGSSYDMAGVPFTKNDKIVYVNNIKNPKKAKSLADSKSTNKKYLIECAHQMAPLTEFDIKTNKTIYILLTADMVLPKSEQYLDLRTEKSLLDDEDLL